MIAAILLVDDEAELRGAVEKILRKLGHRVDVAATGRAALALASGCPYNLALIDFRLPDLDGLELIADLRRLRPEAEVVLMTAFGTIPLAVRAIKQGAYDFLTKPFSRTDLERVVAHALEKQALAAENRRLRTALDGGRDSPRPVIGRSDAIRRVLDMVDQVAPSSATVLIEGESGTGKEVIAEAIHARGPRRSRPLVRVNCGAIPDTLLEAELFGYERGAFTGATGRKEGRFALADGGTLFLDEVATMSPPVQAKLLRVLQDGAFEPLGGTRTVRADCRIIAATNRDLRVEIERGQFREDLFYRLHVITLRLPALRERREDIPLLAHHFLAMYAKKNGKTRDGFSQTTLARLLAHSWPGNIRELEHAVERAVVLSRGPLIDVGDLPDTVRGEPSEEWGEHAPQTIAVPLGTPLEDVERLLIGETLKRTGGNKQQAASLLGIAARTIYRKLAGPPDEGSGAGECQNVTPRLQE